MNSKNNRKNHDFQIAYFLAGDCHTPDGAYALLCDLREDRQMALGLVRANELRKQAKKAKARAVLENPQATTWERLEAEADLAEIDGMNALENTNILAAEAELAFIEKCIARIQPLRKYAHLPDAEAHEAIQQEEWKLELMRRAENYLLTVNHIPTDHFATMRLHPEFKQTILPHIEHLNLLASQENGREKLLAIAATKTFDLPKLLEN